MLSEKKNHSGECKGARVEFKYVDVIPKKGKKKKQAKSPKMLYNAYFIFRNSK